MRLLEGGDKTGLDEKLLVSHRSCRDLEVDQLSPFIDVRLCLASPGSCEWKKNPFTVGFVPTTLTHQNLDHEPSVALKLNLVIAPSSGCVGTNTLG